MNKNALHISIYIPSDFKKSIFIFQTYYFKAALIRINFSTIPGNHTIIFFYKYSRSMATFFTKILPFRHDDYLVGKPSEQEQSK